MRSVLAVIACIAVLVIVSCQQPATSPLHEALQRSEPQTAEQALLPGPVERVLSALADGGDDTLRGRTVCVLPPTQRPPKLGWLPPWYPGVAHNGRARAGQLFAAQWTVFFTDVSQVMGAMPPPAWLFVSTAPPTPPVPLEAWGMPGCWLQVVPQSVITPQAGSILDYAEKGRFVRLQWVLPEALRGVTFRVQLVVAVPQANAAGLVLSPVLEFTVGS